MKVTPATTAPLFASHRQRPVITSHAELGRILRLPEHERQLTSLKSLFAMEQGSFGPEDLARGLGYNVNIPE